MASADAPDWVKSRADYVCDGADDQAEISAALESAGPWAEVRLAGGTFNVTAPITLDGLRARIVGLGRGSTLLDMDAEHAGERLLSGKDVDVVSIRDLTIDKHRPDGTLQGGAIDIRGGSEVHLDSVEVLGSTFEAIYLEGINRVTVRRSVTRDSNSTGVRLASCKWIAVEGCDISDAGGNGIFPTSCDTVRIDGNRVYNSGDEGIEIGHDDAQPPSRRVVVSNNVVENAPQVGIYVNDVPGAVVTGNAVQGAEGIGIYVRQNDVTAAATVTSNHVDVVADGIHMNCRGSCVGNLVLVQASQKAKSGILLNGDAISCLANTVIAESPEGLEAGIRIGPFDDRRGNMVQSNHVRNASEAITDQGTNGQHDQVIGGNYVERCSRGVVLSGDSVLVEANVFVQVSSPVECTGRAVAIRDNQGYVTQSGGTASLTHGDTIAHGLALAPTQVHVTAMADGYLASITECDSGCLRVSVVDRDGEPVTRPTPVSWSARA